MTIIRPTMQLSNNILVDKNLINSSLRKADLKYNKGQVNKNLGQVFTPTELAKFMISLLPDKAENSKLSILDPCIGPNTFFNHLPESLNKYKLTGIEIDNSLLTEDIIDFYNVSRRELRQESFFDLPLDVKFDCIIQNPPYVRQELLTTGVNAKSKIKLISENNSITIPPNSNLYIYFLVKSMLHLKKGGVMVAVIYDSWLYNTFGIFLKEVFLKLGWLEQIFHFKQNAFDNAEVGATVIKFVKTKSKKSHSLYYSINSFDDFLESSKNFEVEAKIKSNELLQYNFNPKSKIDFDSCFFSQINELSDIGIQRGTSAIINKYFISKNKRFAENKPLIKDISKIKTYNAEAGDSYILIAQEKATDNTLKYIKSIEKEIAKVGGSKYKAVKSRIQTDNSWYHIKPKKAGNIIFNYYLRNNIDFILNSNNHLVSDNFYILNIAQNVLPIFAILNSSFSKLAILLNSRNQGSGLRKIQLYEFKDVKIINADRLTQKTLDQLAKLGQTLLTTNRYSINKQTIIESIDTILLNEYNKNNKLAISMDDIQIELKSYIG